ncbi:MAG: hypothetical protein V3R29_07835 [Candidatus Acidoferrales bacterium]
MNQTGAGRLNLDRVHRVALGVGVVVSAVCVVAALDSPQQFFRSYLLAYLFWMNLALGCLALVMLHHLVGGQWGMVIRRLLESGTRTLPLLLLLFLPLVFGLQEIYPWTHPEKMAEPALQHKAVYLNVPFFLARAGIYFAVWLLLAYLLNRWSSRQDQSDQPALGERLRVLSAPGLILYGLTATFASVDWVMSLEPHWFSTVYGMMFILGQVLAALTFVIVILMLLSDRAPLAGFLRPQHFHDLGNLLLAFVMLWAYVSFTQYLIIWSGNLPEEIPWYLDRTGHGWQGIAVVLIVLHFAVPFVLLLNRPLKRRARALAGLAVGLFLLRWFDLFWIVSPAFYGAEVSVHWMDVALPIGLGGLWLTVFFGQVKGRPLLPLQDPNVKRALEEASAA